jgi:outer membrane protein insertion porin family
MGGPMSAQTGAKKRPARPAASKPVPTPPAAKPEAGELAEFPIASLAVEGNALYPESAILRVAGLKVGDPANKPLLEAARDRLLATGAFDSVGYRYFTASDGRSYEAVFQLVEAEPYYPVRFDGLGVEPGEIAAFLAQRDPLYAPRLAATKTRIDLYTHFVNEFLETRKAPGGVTAKVEADAPGQLTIVFRPGGGLPAVADVAFTGNDVVPTAVLKPLINGVAVGVPYNEARFRQLLDTSVRPEYEARGRLRVKFPRVEVRPAAEVRGVLVTVTVEEGPVYRLGDLRVLGEGLPERELLKQAGLEKGDLANMKTVASGMERIRDWLRDQGHVMAVATPERRYQDAEERVDLTIAVDPGPRYTFGKLNLVGLDIHSEPVIRKMWAIREGEPYRPAYADLFLKRIQEEQVFENLTAAASEQKLNAETLTADVTLLFGRPAEKRSILKNDSKP